MQNILYIIPSLRLAGAEKQIIGLVNGLSEKRFNIHLFTFESPLDQLDSLNKQKVKFYNYPRRYKFDFSPSKKIAEIINRENIDIIDCRLQIALLYGFLGRILAKKKVKFTTSVHTTINRNRKDELLDRLLYVQLMKYCDRVITVCENQRKYWIRKYPFLEEKCITIHNGIDIDEFKDDVSEDEKKALRASLKIEDDELLVGTVAGFRPEKGHEYILRALKLLLNSGVKIKLILIGDGERRNYLQSLAHELGIWRNVIWLGLQKEPKKYISIFDIFLMASYRVETFSNAIIEALSMSKPVIATDVGGTSEMVKDGVNGFLVRPKNPEDISEKITYFIKNPQCFRRFSQNARLCAVEGLSKERTIMKTEELLMTLA
ncbi:MAG: glycosyltransferase family 1 protein [Candidatus Jettenia sp.]|uniref:Putative glycosyltransferase n=1 Tax=Candidatus Jettenia caeni TaxID=247490 RepID=I3IIR9_9BACT|nr:glycosyltransferase family 4 protein [Candidatus Jettenia sp. AMX1]MBC6930099.1 glycosyltransferase family 1 protein [Candidatus Jettenia sp.]WKZ16929.1 MAG: glycosyltransferase family 4 protein [Candidatus Jettenia caeni]KAA0248012.1 MAG: glycosyltransferase family 1 protein [Candidatus Jettenia sp. AMX1]MCE7881776.1 glycosyltransferase family 1 protein [Candidatus Jettenia sp. AMX1]MCQ3928398.1 glycosyltransferase family 1 protein [Candidatus Jettenia sp.]